jgi:hypothetical protein
LPSGVAYKRGEDGIRKLVINYRKEGLKMHLKGSNLANDF